MRLYIIRHGDPDYENNTITPAGHLEAKALAEHLKDVGLDKIYYSPLGRAVDTMKYTADLLNIEPQVEEWTEEISHDIELEKWGGLHICDIPGEVVRNLEPGASHENWYQRKIYSDPELIVKIKGIWRNSDDFIKRNGYEREGECFRCIKPNSEKIAIFCHAALGMTWLAYLLGIPLSIMWSGFWPAPSSVTTVLFEERSQNWAVPRCIGFGDVSHLNIHGLPISPRGIKSNFY